MKILFLLVLFLVPTIPVLAVEPDELKKGDGIALIVRGTGEMNCSDRNQFRSVELFIWLSEAENERKQFTTSGIGLKTLDNYRMASGLNAAEINSDGFDISGTVLVDEICGEELVSITAKGSCGMNVSVSVNTSTKNIGNFQANVDCI